MNALSLYVTTCRMVFQADVNNAGAWSDINRLILYLRQALTCIVCGQLLKVPMSSSVASCQHHVCKSCIGGKMRLKPSCSWCKDYSKFIENIQLRILLQCYKRLALYIKQSDISKRWATLQTGNTPGVLIGSSANSTYNQNNNCPTNFKDLIDEGSNLPDKYTFFEPPSLRNLNRSSASLTQQSSNSTSSSSLNSTSLDGGLVSKSVQPITASVKPDKKDADPLLKQTQATVVRLTTTDGSTSVPLSNQVSNHPLHSHTNTNHQSSSTPSSSSLNSSMSAAANAPLLTPTKSKQHKVRKGCRCGLATLNPGKLTCCGQRCPCYVEGKACVDCRCRGCRNPNKLNSSHEPHSIKHSNLLTSRTSPILITTSAINISTSNLTNNASSLISTSPNLFTSNLQLSNSSNPTTLLSSPAAGTRNLLSPSFLLSSSPNQTASSATLVNNSNQMLRGNGSANLFQTGTKFNLNLISTTSSPFILGHHNVGSVSTVDSLTLPFPTIESIEDQVILSGSACIEEDASSLHQIIN